MNQGNVRGEYRMSPYLVVRHVFSTQASRPNAGADGMQKTHYLGGTERARISEQCLRRALLDVGGIGRSVARRRERPGSHDGNRRPFGFL